VDVQNFCGVVLNALFVRAAANRTLPMKLADNEEN
jgi:hypothetical protein